MFENNVNENESIESLTLPSGLANLVGGYMEYVYEVVKERAIVALDGLKPSQRRILVTMKEIEKVKSFTKCASIVGTGMKLHPHGNASLYETLCRMTDVSEVLNIPLIKGKGKFKKVYSDEPSAADRYTECSLMPIVDEYFNDNEGVDRVPNYDNSRTEPDILGVSFPSVLCNPTLGIAVGIASNIPAFNFADVIDATINVVQTGRVGMELIPDFTTGGEYIYNQEELKKIIRKGKGKIKLRGKWHVDGRTITIDEIPYYTSIQKIMKVAENIQGVTHCKDLSGLKGGKTVMRLDIECRDKNTVQYVLYQLLNESDLQMTITTNIAVIIDGAPRVLGVEELLQEWVKFRKGVLTKKYKLQLAAYEADIARYEIFVALLTNETLRKEFIDALSVSESKGFTVLRDAFPNADEDILNWILDMKIRALSSSEKAVRKLNDLKAGRDVINTNLADISAVIVKQLKDLKMKYSYPRKTAVTNVDYTFDKAAKVEAYDVVVTISDKFLTKTAQTKYNETAAGYHCKSDSVLCLVDNLGRLLRINLENVPLTATGSRGTYIPSYCGVPDNFEIVDCNLVENRKIGYIYSDGFSSILDLSEWVDVKRNTKMTPNGMPETTYLICGKYNPASDYVYVCTSKGRFCFIYNNFKEKNRTARTRIVTPDKDEYITVAKGLSKEQAFEVMPTYTAHIGKLGYIGKDEAFNLEELNKM